VWAAGVVPHYCVNVTGHGWRKLMRHPGNFTYRIAQMPPPLPVLEFMQREAPLAPREAYGSLNMGAGFALFVAPEQAETAVHAARRGGIDAWISGSVEAGARRLIVEPLGLVYEAAELELRG
jgi:phosphoribosylformylglycinamidine cyclo-ligase